MAAAPDLQALLDNFASVLANDPGPLQPDSPYYVPDLHGSGADDVVAQLARTIRRNKGSELYYFSGQRGTGKSTELRRLAGLLEGPDCTVHLVDLLEYVDMSRPVELVDLLLVVALSFAERLSARHGKDFLKEEVATRLMNWLQTEVEITEASFADVKAVFRTRQQSIVQRVRDFKLDRRERFEEQCRDFIRDLGKAERQRKGVAKVVLMLDSLERLRGVGNDASAMFDSVVRVFDGALSRLRISDMQVVYAVPPYLPYLANVRQYVAVTMLASVRVFERPTLARRQPRASGLATMRAVVDKRCPRWRELLSEAALDSIILDSGGDIRQLLKRLLLDVLDAAYFSLGSLPLAQDEPILAQVRDKHRVEFEQFVVQEEYALLHNIAIGNTVDLARRSDLPVAARMFEIRAVLNYRNGTDWVDLNPLLWPLMDGWTPPVAVPADASANPA